MYVYQHALGKSLSHNTVAQEKQCTLKPLSEAKTGDLLFWGSRGSSYHVAIYIGNNQFVAAPDYGQNVQIQSFSTNRPSFAGTVK